MLWASPGVAALWWLLAVREIQRPALASIGLATRLPPEAEREVVAALVELPDGTARELLADVVRVGQRLAGAGGADGDERALEIGQVLLGASRAARQIAEVEESLANLERRSNGDDPRLVGAADLLERGRDRLVQELLEVLTTMARTQGRLVLAGDAARIGGEELTSLAAAIEQSVGFRTEAEREVNALLAVK